MNIKPKQLHFNVNSSFLNLMKNVVSIMLLILLGSCNRNEPLVSWDTELKFPLASARLSVEDILPDSMVIANSDSSLNFVYNRTLSIDSFGDILNVPDTLNEVSIKLQQLVLAEQSIEDTVRLRDIYPPATLLNGQTVVLPAQDLDGAGNAEIIDVSQDFFRTAVFREGRIEITLHNDLPVVAELLVFRLSNQDDKAIILSDTFRNIQPTESRKESYSLAGKRVNGVMVGEILKVKTAASDGPVTIDANKGVRIQLRVFDLEPEFATAVFPAQTLVADSQETIYDLGGPKITEMHLKGGYVVMDVISTIQEEIILDYFIPNSRNSSEGGIPIKKVYKVPPAEPGKTSRIRERFPMDGFTVVYKGKDPNTPPYWNTVFSMLTARIEYSGIERTLSLDDSVRVRFGLVEIDPDYAIGEFGTRTNEIKDSLLIPFFQKSKGQLNPEDISIELELENSFGIDAQLELLRMVAVNPNTNQSVRLHAAPLNGPFMIRKATNPPLRFGTSSLLIDKSNSNIRQFLSILPERIDVELRATSSPFGTQNLSDFVFASSRLDANIRVNIPLVFAADSAVINQRVCLSESERKELTRFGDGYLVLEAENSLPFQLGFSLENLAGNLSLSDLNKQLILAGVFDPMKERVISARKSTLRIPVTRSTLKQMAQDNCFDLRFMIHSEDIRRYPIQSNQSVNVKLRYEGAYEVEI
jgi:hypothetical protein